MTNHIQITFSDIQPEQQEWVIAHLAEAGYDGFEENENELKAFIPEDSYDKFILKELAFKYQLAYSEQKIAAQNWNAVWESNFKPVIVDDFVAVRADFHAPIKEVKYEIIITPKMSFGTGHHATTYMMLEQMREIDFAGKEILDFGTGTGVLAILAEKLGAASIIAIDIDEWSIENANENIKRNSCSLIDLKKADSAFLPLSFGVILANINKNVIMDNMPALASQLIPGGTILLSGLLKNDEEDIKKAAEEESLHFSGKAERDNWLCLKFVR